MKSKDLFSWTGTAIVTIMTAIQENPVFQYINLGITILSSLFAMAFTIWKWWKKAKKDGKIDDDEVDELIDKVNNVIDDKKKGDKDE